MTFEIRGVAHPPPSQGGREDPADLTAAEMNCQRLAGRPLLNEHQGGERVGTCLTSWEGQHGELRISAAVSDPKMQKQILNGSMRGLSLGTDMVGSVDGKVLYRGQAELSVCEQGRRSGTWIDTINGKNVYKRRNASASAPPADPCFSLPPSLCLRAASSRPRWDCSPLTHPSAITQRWEST